MIPDEKKEEVREAADIVEVISDYVKLKRSGSGYVGLCPFHDENTPSFHVTPRLNIYKCFGCGESGDVFNFVMDMEGVGFTESIRSLADRYHISLPEQDEEEYDEEHHLREGMYHALRYAGLFYYRNLTETDEAEKARKYLKERGYTQKIIKKYGLGYAPARGDAFYKSALDTGLSEQYLEEAGLIKSSNRGDGYYDTFRGRLMFPIFNPSGKVIAFAGRVLGNKKMAKYINSPQTKVYNKSQTVYAINFAKHEIRKHKEAILVEGYTDVLTMHQAGIGWAVATSGTSLTPEQLKSIHRYGDTVVFVYDSDAAGVNAMLRGIDMALAEGLDVKLLALPEGEDPDSFVKQFGKESFMELKEEEAEDFISFIVHKTQLEGKWNQPAEKKKMTSRILESIARIDDPVSREMFVQHLNSFLKVGDRALLDELAKIRNSIKKQQQRSRRYEKQHYQKRTSQTNLKQDEARKAGSTGNSQQKLKTTFAGHKKHDYEEELIRLMLMYNDDMITYIGSLCNAQQFEHPELRQFYTDIIERFKQEKPVTVEHYSNREHPYPQLVGEIVLDQHFVSERTQQEEGQRFKKDKFPYRTAKGALKTLKIHYLNRLQQHYNQRYQIAEGEEKKELNRSIREIGRQRAKLQRTSQDHLFPDPEESGKKITSPVRFEYKMKSEKKQQPDN